MQKFHGCSASVDKDKHIAKSNVISHFIMNKPTKRIYSFAHICLPGTQEVAHRIIQAEHGYIIY